MHNLYKPPLDELAHFGVKGMRWGVRKDGTLTEARQIRDARKSTGEQAQALNKAHRETRSSATQLVKNNPHIKDQRMSYLNNPDRVTAVKLTKGENFILSMLSAPVLVAPNPVSVGALSTLMTSGVARRTIEKKQRTGAYS